MASTRKPPARAAGGKAGIAAGTGAGIAVPLRPPLEKALDGFTRELRAVLDRSATESAALRAELKALRAELDTLRQRYAAHTHSYALTQTGGGGQQWIELRFLQGYIDGEVPGYKNYGFWARGKSTSGQPAEQPTSGPSA